MVPERPRVVIVGGGFGGLGVARRLRRQALQAEIVLIDHRPSHVFTPWLYDLALGRAGGAEVSFFALLSSTLRGVRFRQADVSRIDCGSRHVFLSDGGTLRYDALVLAPGSSIARPSIPGLNDHALVLKSPADALAISEQVRSLFSALAGGTKAHANIVIAGAGPSGLELACGLYGFAPPEVHNRLHVTLLDTGPRPAGQAGPVMARAIARRLQNHEIRLALSTRLAEARAHEVIVEPGPVPEKGRGYASPFREKTTLPCDMLFWHGGTSPSPLLKDLPFPKDPRGRIRVDATFEVRDFPGVFVLGDAAAVMDGDEGPLFTQTAQAATVEAKTVAANVTRVLSGRSAQRARIPRQPPMIITVGRHEAFASLGGVLLWGRIGYILRRVADLHYFLRILPWRAAYRLWSRRRLSL